MKIGEFEQKFGAFGVCDFDSIKKTIYEDKEEQPKEEVGKRVLATRDRDTILGYVKLFHAMAHADNVEICGRVAGLMYTFARTFREHLHMGAVPGLVAKEVTALYLQTVERLFTTKQGRIGTSRDEVRLRTHISELLQSIVNASDVNDLEIQATCHRIFTLFQCVQTQQESVPSNQIYTASTTENTIESATSLAFIFDRVPHRISNGAIDLCPLTDLATRIEQLNLIPSEVDQLNEKIKARLPAEIPLSDPASLITVNGQRYILSRCPRSLEQASNYVSTVIGMGGSLFVSVLEDHEAPAGYNNFWTENKIKQLDLQGWNVIHHETHTHAEGIMPNAKGAMPFITETVITLQRGDEQRRLTHLHYNKWVDRMSVPDEELFDTLLERILELRQHPGEIIAVNCHGGVARSGATVAGLYVRSHINSLLDAGMDLHEIEIDIPSMICDLRLQRLRALKNPNCLYTTYRTTARYCAKIAKEALKQ